MVTAGVGGGLTGKGGDIIIVDDPVKNAAESLSETIRQNVWDWYTSTLYTRLEPGSKMIIVQTRWHEDDLSGRLLEQMRKGGSDRWAIIDLPAVAGENDALGRNVGEALWPERYDLTELAKIEKTLGPYWYSALYQQQPIPLGKGLFQRQWLGRYTIQGDAYLLKRPDGSSVVWSKHAIRKFATVDLATSTKQQADYTCISVWGQTPSNELLLLGVDRRQMEGPDHVAMLQGMWLAYNPYIFGIEKAGFQLSTIQTALRAGLPVMELVPKGDKAERALSAAARMKAGYYFFPEGDLYAEEEKELWQFPGGPHDDFVDTVSYSFILSNGMEYAGNLE